jgi:hypothetical protein
MPFPGGNSLTKIKPSSSHLCDHSQLNEFTDIETSWEKMDAAVKAGSAYFGAVFVIGFMLGTFRVLVLVPRIGEIASVLLETPLILAVSWLVSGWATERFCVSSTVSRRLLMGVVAFALLMLAEIAVSIFAFGRSIEDHLTGYRSWPGLIGLIAQIAFAFIPLVQRNWR